MSIQHKDIPDSELHLPKGVSTAVNKQIYVANGAGTGVWRTISEDDIVYTDKTVNRFGWNYRKDDLYSSGSPLAIATGVKTLFSNNGGNALTDVTRPLGIVYTSTQFTPSSLFASYMIRVAFKTTTASPAGTPYTIKVTLEGGAIPVQFAGQDQTIKGGGYVNDVSISFLFYTGTLNTNNPIKIYLTPDTNVSVYDLDYLIQRTYVET